MPRKDGIFSNIYKTQYGFTNVYQLFDATKNSKSFVQRLRLQVKIPAHNGCVNSICWSETGKYLLSGADDQHLCVTDAYTHSILAYTATGHRGNIFSAKFMPRSGDCKVISCSGDGLIIYSDLDNANTSMTNKFNCHSSTTYEIMTVPKDPNTFLSCGEDGTIRWFDLRIKTSCKKEDCKEDVLINCQTPVTALSVNPVAPYQLAAGCSDASVRIYDRRMLGTAATGGYNGNCLKAVMANFTVPDFTSTHRITSLGYSKDGSEMLVSYSSDFVYLFDIRNAKDSKMFESGPDCNRPINSVHTPFSNQPLKRLRVRGDWSDTGPNARPERESRGEQQPRSLHASLVQRMSEIVTSIYISRTQRQNSSRSNSHSEDSEAEDEPNESGTNVATGGHDDDVATGGHDNAATGDSSADLLHEQQMLSGEPSSSIQVSTCESAANENGVTLASCDQTEQQQLTHTLKSPEVTYDGVDFPFTAIKVSTPSVSSISDSKSENNHSENAETVNLSLQNIRQELLQHNAETKIADNSEAAVACDAETTVAHDAEMKLAHDSETTVAHDAETPVATAASSVPEICGEDVREIDPSLSSNDARRTSSPTSDQLCTNIDHGANPYLEKSRVEVKVSGICDNELLQLSNSCTPTTTTSASCDPSTSVVQEQSDDEEEDDNELDGIHPSISLSDSVQVPDIYIANVPSQAEASTSQVVPQDDVSFMVDMGTWELDSEEDSRSPLSSSQRSDYVHEKTMSTLVDSCSKDEETECKHEFENYSLSPYVRKKYTGHRNSRTMIKEASFWGDNFILCGSDCGHIFIWDRHTTELVMLMEADHHVVNCLQPHPFDPILASSGIDYDIKIWAPLREEPFFDTEKAEEIVKRNEIMLEETKDTLTVPATFMIRMLASVQNMGSGSGWRRIARRIREGGQNRSTQ